MTSPSKAEALIPPRHACLQDTVKLNGTAHHIVERWTGDSILGQLRSVLLAECTAGVPPTEAAGPATPNSLLLRAESCERPFSCSIAPAGERGLYVYGEGGVIGLTPKGWVHQNIKVQVSILTTPFPQHYYVYGVRATAAMIQPSHSLIGRWEVMPG